MASPEAEALRVKFAGDELSGDELQVLKPARLKKLLGDIVETGRDEAIQKFLDARTTLQATSTSSSTGWPCVRLVSIPSSITG